MCQTGEVCAKEATRLANGANARLAADFWKRVRSISVSEIAREAERPLSVAVVGPPEARAAAIARLREPDTSEATTVARPSSPLLQEYGDTQLLPGGEITYDVILHVAGDRGEVTGTGPVYSVDELGGWDQALDRIIADRPELALALGRSFPAFRGRVAQQIIQQTAATNAQFTLLTGIASAVPIADLIGLPASALSDIVILTKNQILMCLRLAAVYGLEVQPRRRLKELGPILANAFGWRTVARTVLGQIPFAGLVGKPLISYAGTVTLGKAAQVYYETGEMLTGAQFRRLYRDSVAASRLRVQAMVAGLRKRSAPAIEARQISDERLITEVKPADSAVEVRSGT